MPQTHFQKGISLTELVVCLTVALLILVYSAHSFNRIAASNKATAGINWIIRCVQFTRNAAIHYNRIVTLCPLNTQGRCTKNWHQGVTVFIDHNADARINGKDKILRQIEFSRTDPGASLHWRAFRNRPYLQMTPTGHTNYQNGNFTYCPSNQDQRYARQIVINQQGRIKKSRDSDGDGLIEDIRGQPLKCHFESG